MILRDFDTDADWDAAPEEELEDLDARYYYCQNWRADVSVIIDDSATIIERAMYSPYGVPFGVPAGDLCTSSSFAEPVDGVVDSADTAVLLGAYSGSWNYADLDNDGDVDSDDLAVHSSNYGDNLGWGLLSNHHNRFGYAGYVFDQALAGTKWHVRHRVLESVLGRWISRDPLGYRDGVGLLAYTSNSPIVLNDATGTCSTCLPADVNESPSSSGSPGGVSGPPDCDAPNAGRPSVPCVCPTWAKRLPGWLGGAGALMVDCSCAGVLPVWYVPEDYPAWWSVPMCGQWYRADAFAYHNKIWKISNGSCVIVTCCKAFSTTLTAVYSCGSPPPFHVGPNEFGPPPTSDPVPPHDPNQVRQRINIDGDACKSDFTE